MNTNDNAPAPRPSVKNCHVCGGTRIHYLFTTSGYRVVRCDNCGLLFLNPQPSDAELGKTYTENYFLGSEHPEAGLAVSEIKQATARLYLSEIQRYRGAATGKLLEVGCGNGDFLVQAEADGWAVTGVEYAEAACEKARQKLKPSAKIICGELAAAKLPAGEFDLCILSDVIEHVRAPLDFLREVHRVLKPGGVVFIATPSVDSWSAKLMKQAWMEFKVEHLTYFGRQTLETALFNAGFRETLVQPGWKILTLDYICRHFERFPVRFVTPAMKLLRQSLPDSLLKKNRRVVASGIMAFARKAEVRAKPVLSVIVPAFNEAQTLGELMDALRRKELPGLDLEIILVESNSTDGTRAIAEKYQDAPGVKLILEDAPRGKGHAVRTGLAAATGDYVLIQDADLEYDLEDYDALLEYLVSGRAAFVLGSRHGGENVLKMRQFTGKPGLSLFFNIGHWVFTTLVNVLFFQRLRDPFTMFKVFRRDCLYGLEFESNRFDFDYELLIKLLRKGHQPVELPVNYRSRSYVEGKKVRVFSDPVSWLKILVRLRLMEIDPLAVVEKSRRAK
jgi:SAM-dependent methyltransferase